eukprot:2963453-Pleurochrysis_carterae.AAC.1
MSAVSQILCIFVLAAAHAIKNTRQTPSWRRAASRASRSSGRSLAARYDTDVSLVSAKPVILEL